MTVRVLWEKQAQADREGVFRSLYREAGLQVANATDHKFVTLAALLEGNPKAGVKTGKQENRRRLTVARFPFIIAYATKPGEVYILRILHTPRKTAMQYR